jgi:hypothetical protein
MPEILPAKVIRAGNPDRHNIRLHTVDTSICGVK